MSELPLYSGKDPLGCTNQVHKARTCTTSLPQLRIDELSLIRRTIFSISDPLSHLSNNDQCGCKIAENGCIDPSECAIDHMLFAIPKINRWCDETTSNLFGAAHTLFWSGWARPAVLSLTSRYATVEGTRDLLRRSHVRTKHMSHRFAHVIEFDSALQSDVVHLYPKHYSERGFPRAKELLMALPPTLRFGQHSTLNGELVTLPEVFDESYPRL